MFRPDLSVSLVAAASSPWLILADVEPETIALVLKVLATILGPACTLIVWRLLRAGSLGVRAFARVLRGDAEKALDDDDPANDYSAQQKLRAAEVLDAFADGLEEKERARRAETVNKETTRGTVPDVTPRKE